MLYNAREKMAVDAGNGGGDGRRVCVARHEGEWAGHVCAPQLLALELVPGRPRSADSRLDVSLRRASRFVIR